MKFKERHPQESAGDGVSLTIRREENYKELSRLHLQDLGKELANLIKRGPLRIMNLALDHKKVESPAACCTPFSRHDLRSHEEDERFQGETELVERIGKKDLHV